jgi:hypothetical protein
VRWRDRRPPRDVRFSKRRGCKSKIRLGGQPVSPLK